MFEHVTITMYNL